MVEGEAMRTRMTVEAVLAAFLLVVGTLGTALLAPASANLVAADAESSIYLSSTTGGSVDGITFADEDIVAYDLNEEA